MKVYNLYLNGDENIFCTYLSKEKAEEATKNLSRIRIEEGEVGGINLWELNQTRCLEDLLAEEKETLREYRLAVASLVDGATTIHRVLKAQSNYWTAKQAIRDYFSAVQATNRPKQDAKLLTKGKGKQVKCKSRKGEKNHEEF